MDSLMQLFYDEANEMVEGMEQVLLALESGEPDPETVNALFRYAHSFKGNSAAMGFTHLSKFTHGLESAMEALRKEQRTLTPELATLLLQAVDMIRTLLERTRTEGDVGDPTCEPLLQQINAVINGETPPSCCRAQRAYHIQRVHPCEAHRDARNSADASVPHHLSACANPQRGTRPVATVERTQRVRAGHRVPIPRANPAVGAAQDRRLLRRLGNLLRDGVRACDYTRAAGACCRRRGDAHRASERSVCRDHAGDACQAATPLTHPPSCVAPAQPRLTTATAAAAAAAVNAAASKGEAQSIRVSTEKIDALMNLVSEIVIAQSMLSSAQNADTDERTRAAITQMERHVRDLHERVMAIRLLPVSYLFNRFPRMVRDTAAKLGKKVNFEVEGEETELDRTLLEALSDPLTHLIRNAIDHGIEPPDERRQNGKPETGTIKLSAYQSEGRIYIEVRDDGRGINTERVREKAIQLGWITENDHPSEETLFEFLFQPGFSTAQQVSDLSGRGVGMDVVKRNVESLGGSISVQSKRGEGTRFLLRVPLTLAIMDGLGLTVADEHYIVPLTAVVEAFQYESLQHTALFDQYEMVNVRGEFIPLVRLRQFVGLPETDHDGLIVVLEQEGEQIALLIDGIAGQQQVVLKSLEENFVRVHGFAGATILGDGRVALILDVSDLIRRGRQSAERYAAVA
jgi:two-component system chemotaxis sensor kinase CheA